MGEGKFYKIFSPPLFAMNDTMLLDRMAQMIRVGFVNARMPEKMRVKVTIPDTTGGELITDFLPVLCPRASQDMQYDLPDVGDQVLCLFLPYGLEQGFVIGAMYGKQAPPVQSGDKWHRLFKDGTWLEYDRESHELTAEVVGNAKIKCQELITLEAPIIYLRGKLVNTDQNGAPGKASISGEVEVTNGGVSVPDADVIAKGVSLVSHTIEGVEPGSGTSQNPTGGSAVSPGTEATPVPKYGTEEYAAWTAARLEELEKDVQSRDNEIHKLIMCLPKIAIALANEEKGKGRYDLEQAYYILAEILEKWLAGLFNDDAMKGGEPYFMSWDTLMQFPRFYKAYFAFTASKPLPDTRNIFNEDAKLSLGNYLCKNGYMQPGETIPFDFIGSEKDWQKWEKNYYTSYPVPPEAQIELDYTMITLGGFTLRALAKGEVTWLKDKKYKITVEKIAVVLWDSINFHNEKDLLNWGIHYIFGLGYWQCDPPFMYRVPLFGGTKLKNGDFQLFRLVTSHGCDFMVLTKPHMVESFNGESYDYACTK